MGLPPFSGVVWLNGQYLPIEHANVNVMTHTLHYGFGVFEGVRAYETDKGPAIFRLQAHTDRLFRSAHMLNMKLPYTKEELNEVQQELLRKNNLNSAYIRPLCFTGPESLGLRLNKDTTVNVMVAAWSWGAYMGKASLETGINLCVSSYSRHSPNSTLGKAKACGNYINSILATQEALANGYDEVLMLDVQGYVAEASSSNFFMVVNGELITPPTESCLQGITRDSIMHMAHDLGIPVIERRITRDEVYVADEAFLTGTAVEMTPICSVDKRTIGQGKPGPITLQLQEGFFAAVSGKGSAYPEWLTLV
ncbi:MAG: branched-chain amino acid transaminase [Legionellales bacterium]|jgi:branched-chain amino acid aminotransferase